MASGGLRARAVRLALLGGTAAVGAIGCPAFVSWDLPPQGGDASTTTEGDGSPKADAGVDSDAGADHGTGGGSTCNGVCAAIQKGWGGPWIVSEAKAGTPLPACADGGAPSFAFGGLNASPAICSPCSCSYSLSAGCSSPSIVVYPNGESCDASSPQAITVGQCTSISISRLDLFSVSSSPLAGSCQANTAQPPSLGPTSFGTIVTGCLAVPASASCAGGAACFAPPPAGFMLCVVQAGEMPACPQGFPNMHLYGSDQTPNDTRSCTDCTCDTVPDSCEGSVDLFGAMSSCLTATSKVPLPTTCASLTSGTLVTAATSPEGPALDPQGASCQPGGGQPTGKVSPANPVTYCCL